jgi:hypothetical protein
MADLYVSMLGVPYRAVVASPNGQRTFVRIGERADDDYGLDPDVWIDADGVTVGAQAGFLHRSGRFGEFRRPGWQTADAPDESSEWSDRDVVALLLRRFITAGELQSGESMQRVVCIVPSGLDAERRSLCVQAGLLAGAQTVETLSAVDVLRSAGTRRGVSGFVALVDACDDVTRLTLLDMGRDEAPALISLLSPTWSRSALPELLAERLGSAASHNGEFAPEQQRLRTEAAHTLARSWVAGRDVSHGQTVSVPVAEGVPFTLFAPASTFAQLESSLARDIGEALVAQRVQLPEVKLLLVTGSWRRPMANVLRALFAGAAVVSDRGLEFDGALRLAPPTTRTARHVLSSDILASADQRYGKRQAQSLRLLEHGPRTFLPATSIREDFDSSSFLGTFVVTADAGGQQLPLTSIPIPRYAERQGFSYLRVVIHAETESFLLLETAYLYSSKRRFVIYDKVARTESPVADRIFRLIRQLAA